MMNFSKIKLSKRLALFAHFYEGQDIVWDVGCDHAQLGLFFINAPRTPKIHLVDPSLAVIKKLNEKLLGTDIPRVHLFHMKGQDIEIDQTFSHFIFIAGMGGLEIISILENILPQLRAQDKLLISPHNKVLEVRAFLRSMGQCLHKEQVIKEGGIWYPHFLLGQEGTICSTYGDEIYEGERGVEYLEYLREKVSKGRDIQSKEFLNFLNQFKG